MTSEGSFSFAAGASGPRLRGADIGFGDRNESNSGLASLTFVLITRFGLAVSKIRIQKYNLEGERDTFLLNVWSFRCGCSQRVTLRSGPPASRQADLRWSICVAALIRSERSYFRSCEIPNLSLKSIRNTNSLSLRNLTKPRRVIPISGKA